MTSRSVDGAERLTAHGIEPDVDPIDRSFHRALALTLVVIVGGAFVGLFGPRTERISASAEGVDLVIDYPSIARPGLAATFAVTVTGDSPLPDPLTIEVAADYMAMYDENGLGRRSPCLPTYTGRPSRRCWRRVGSRC